MMRRGDISYSFISVSLHLISGKGLLLVAGSKRIEERRRNFHEGAHQTLALFSYVEFVVYISLNHQRTQFTELVLLLYDGLEICCQIVV